MYLSTSCYSSLSYTKASKVVKLSSPFSVFIPRGFMSMQIPDTGIRKMILHMIQLDPESRFSAENYLQSYASVVFPSYFSPFLHNFYACLNLLDCDGGDVVTVGTDLKIRCWDHNSPERSYSVCGPPIEGDNNYDFYEAKSNFGLQVVQEKTRRPLASKLSTKAVLAAAATDPAGCHRDSVLSLASVKLNQLLLLSSGRDGAIKVWK